MCAKVFSTEVKMDFYLNPSQLSRRWSLFQNLLPLPSWVKPRLPPGGDTHPHTPSTPRRLGLCLPQTET